MAHFLHKCAEMCKKSTGSVYEHTAKMACFLSVDIVLFLLRGIADAGVIDGLQLLDEYRLGILDVTEGYGTLAEIALSHLGVDNLLYQSADALLGIVGQ